MKLSNQKKLHLTLCNLLPYGLKGKRKDGAIGLYTLSAVYDKQHATWRPDDFGDSTMMEMKPVLYSFSKLTEPVLEGGLIPIMELYKMRTQHLSDKIDCSFIDDNETAILRLLPVKHPHSDIFHLHHFEIDFDNDNLHFSLCTEMHRVGVADFEESFGFIGNEFAMLEKLKEWNFNIFHLPKEMYIEKKISIK